MKRLSLMMLIMFWINHPGWADTERTGLSDNWRIEVGPPGNEFFELQSLTKGTAKKESSDRKSKTAKSKQRSDRGEGKSVQSEGIAAPESVLGWVQGIAPDAHITATGPYGPELVYYGFENERETYWMLLSDDTGLVWLQYSDKVNRIEEAANGIVPDGKRQEIAVDQLPARMTKTLAALIPDSAPRQAWYADTLVGPRYIARVGNVVFYATPGGNIRCAARIDAGGLATVSPDATLGPILPESLRKLLRPYRDRLNVQNQINRLRASAGSSEQGFRFVVMGDSRSQRELWQAMAGHIDRLEPRPLFVINAGDVVLNGTAAEFADYYIPPLLETDVPHLLTVGNHDIGKGGEKGTYQYLFGEGSLNYTFDLGGVRFLFLDNVSGTVPWREVLELADSWLSETPEGYRKIVSTHRPPATIEKWAYHAMSPVDSREFTNLMSKHRVDEVFLGHIHAYSTATLDGVAYTIAGGGGAELHKPFGPLGNVHHYIICDVTADGIIQQVVRFRPKAGPT